MTDAAKSDDMLVTMRRSDLVDLVSEAVAKALKSVPVAANVNAREWYTTAEAAAYCSVLPGAIKSAVLRGRLVPDAPAGPGVRTHRFRKATLDRYLEQR